MRNKKAEKNGSETILIIVGIVVLLQFTGILNIFSIFGDVFGAEQNNPAALNGLPFQIYKQSGAFPSGTGCDGGSGGITNYEGKVINSCQTLTFASSPRGKIAPEIDFRKVELLSIGDFTEVGFDTAATPSGADFISIKVDITDGLKTINLMNYFKNKGDCIDAVNCDGPLGSDKSIIFRKISSSIIEFSWIPWQSTTNIDISGLDSNKPWLLITTFDVQGLGRVNQATLKSFFVQPSLDIVKYVPAPTPVTTTTTTTNVTPTPTTATCVDNQIKYADGSCHNIIPSCVDNNQDAVCEQVIYCIDDDANKICDIGSALCADRDNNKICDTVTSIFCTDNNKNNICDIDEASFFLTSCYDKNTNGICDSKESLFCNQTYNPVCASGITYANKCSADIAGLTSTSGACSVQVIVKKPTCSDCPSGTTDCLSVGSTNISQDVICIQKTTQTQTKIEQVIKEVQINNPAVQRQKISASTIFNASVATILLIAAGLLIFTLARKK